jgi:nucleoside-diphosphate-sugar epimerase
MPRALITGVAGFTGRYLRAELEQHGWEVWGLGQQERPGLARYRRIDLSEPSGQASLQALVEEARADAVVHLAGIAFVGHGDSAAFARVNVTGTRHLLEAVASASHRPSCVLLTSSANVYGNAREGMLDEATPSQPANDYAASKLEMEQVARGWRAHLPIVIARPFNYTGAGQGESFLLPKIVAHFRRRAQAIELGNLDISRDFSDVRAVVQAYRRLIERCPDGQTINVCSGRGHSLRDVLALAEDLTGHPMRVSVAPTHVRLNEVRALCGDASLLRSLIGDWDTPALRDTLRWMLESPDA